MALRSILPLSGAEADITLVKASLVNSVVSLFNETLTPTQTTTKGELEAAEVTHTDYAPKTIAAFAGPYLASVPGYAINSPVQQWIVSTPGEEQLVGGYWIETAGGVVHDIVQFDAPIPFQLVGQVVQFVCEEIMRTSG